MDAISVRFCVGCGYLCDEIHPEGGQPLWIDGHTYVMKYGVSWSDLDRRDHACPHCARVFAIAQRGAHPDFPPSGNSLVKKGSILPDRSLCAE